VANGIPLSPSDPLYIHSDSGYSPEVLSDMQSAEVTFDPSQYPPSQGIGDLGAFQKIGAYLRGVSEWPETIGNYFIRADERLQPSFISGEELGGDIAGLGTAIVEGAREDPLGTIADMTPIVGETRAVMSANNLIKQALAAEDAGDFDKASTLRQLASMEMTSVLPFVPRAAVKRRGIWDDDRRHDPHEPEADRRQRERTLARQRRKQEEERRQQESDARREPPPTPQEPSPTVQDSLFSELDMTPAARLGRAAEQGWNTKRILYHYTPADLEDFTEFKLPDPPKNSAYGPGVYTSPSPDRFGGLGPWGELNRNRIPLFSRGKLATPTEVGAAERLVKERITEGTRAPMLDPGQSGNWRHEYWSDIHQVLKDQGFSGMHIGGEIILMFDPKNLRHIEAEFDPAKADSANLRAGIGSLEAMEGVA